jgi:serine/threonine protein kinase
MNTPDESTCPTCGCPIPSDSPRNLCPKCVLEGVASSASNPVTRGKTVSLPTVEEIAPHFPELEILDLLGAGGMGVVYKARQPQLDRLVALKILSHDLASDPTFAERFNREARVLARLSHPNIVGIFDFGTAGPYCYFLMEYVDGVNLRQAMQAGRFTPTESLAMVTEICSALKFAHEEGILHRDIKPENVLIDSKGRVKIADFGIAKLVGEGGRSDVTLTLDGSILGSPHYMAPEQIETPGDVDQRADIYSLGVVLYEMLTGELPIGRFSLPSEKAAMDQRIDEIVLRTLAKERQARFQSAGDVRTEVEAVTKHLSSVSPALPATDDRPAARFSLTSAILTGISFILAAVLAFILMRDGPMSRAVPGDAAAAAEDISRRLPMMIVAILNGIGLGVTALLGFILGCKALGDVRASGGRKTGAGFAIFAVVAWPLPLAVGLGSNLLPMGPGSPISSMILVVISWGILALNLWLVVGALKRWANGVPTPDGERTHPRFGRRLALAAGITLLGPVLLMMAIPLLPKSEQSSRFEKAMREMDMQLGEVRTASRSESSEDIEWYRGAPELTIPLEVHPGFRAEFRLVRHQNGRILDSAEIGVVERVPGNAPAKSRVKIGTSGPKGKDLVSERGFTALFLYGLDTATTLYGVGDVDEWDINFNQATSVFDEEGLYMIPIATRSGSSTFDDGSIQLEVIVTRE